MTFNPNDLAYSDSNIFGLNFSLKEAQVVILPVPWEVTVSYGRGTSKAINQIIEASKQVDLFDLYYKNNWQKGFYALPVSKALQNKNKQYSQLAEKYIDKLSNRAIKNPSKDANVIAINKACKQMNEWVYENTTKHLKEGKKVVLLGGDHSTPLGYYKAIAEKYSTFGVLQIDAHCDLRIAYEHFTYSHASIMYNALQEIPQIKKLVQIGIRDFCEQEYQMTQQDNRIKTFFNQDIQTQKYKGISFAQQVKEMLKHLPENIIISFDIDGLDPKLCPNTGTPVAGGLEFDEVIYLFHQLHQSKKKIIGIDLVEVGYCAKGDWDANVGARMLYQLCNLFVS